MGDNEAARTTAVSLRTKANEAFVAEEADMKNALGSMDQAIDTLSAIGADQTAKASLVSLKGTVNKIPELKLSVQAKESLKAASIFLTGKQRATFTAFIRHHSQVSTNPNLARLWAFSRTCA